MITTCPKAFEYLKNLNISQADELDQVAWELLNNSRKWELVTKSINDRFIKGIESIPAIDRGGVLTRVKREVHGKNRRYLIEGKNGEWFEPTEKVWVWAMVDLERRKRR